MGIRFVKPDIKHKKAALDYLQEHLDNNETTLHGGAGLENIREYEDWLKFLNGEISNFEDRVDFTTYFAIDDTNNKIIGMIDIRHALNDSLKLYGGNAGYGVRPSERRKGYATMMLEKAIVFCKKLGIKRMLITCDKDNIASSKTIIHCGGQLDCEYIHNNVLIERYWIDI